MTTHDDNVANLVNISQATIRARDSYIEDCLDTIRDQQREIVELKAALENSVRYWREDKERVLRHLEYVRNDLRSLPVGAAEEKLIMLLLMLVNTVQDLAEMVEKEDNE